MPILYNIKTNDTYPLADIYMDTISIMKECTYLHEGQIVETLGYNEINDSCNGLFKIVSSINDDDLYIPLQNSLYALLINRNFSPLQMFSFDEITNGIEKFLTKYKYCYLPKYDYTINSSIELNGNCTFICEGKLISNINTSNLIIVHEDYNKVEVHEIDCNNISNAVNIRCDSSKGDISCFNNIINVDYVINSKTCFYLYVNGSLNGIQYCEINNNYIKNSEYGYYLISNSRITWINENVFNGGKLENVNYGIYLKGNEEMTRCFDGNNFNNIGLEGINVIGIYIEKAWLNNFNSIRAMESLKENAKWFVIGKDADCNTLDFNGVLNRNTYQVGGTRNIIKGILPNSAGEFLTMECYTYNNELICNTFNSTIASGMYNNVYNQTKNISEFLFLNMLPLILISGDSGTTELIIDRQMPFIYILCGFNNAICQVMYKNNPVLKTENLTNGITYLLIYDQINDRYLACNLNRLIGN